MQKTSCLRSFSYSLFIFAALLFLTANNAPVFAQGLPVAAPQADGMSAEKLGQIDALVEKDIADKKLPGAVVIIGHKGKIVFRKAFGNRALVPNVEKMTVDTIFDVASLTKVVATTTSMMILIEQGKIRLNDTVGKYIPEIQDEDVKKITIQQLMTHVSGFAPDFDLREKWTGRDGMLQALYKEKLRQPSGTKFVYSDINFIVLGETIKRVSGESLEVFANSKVFLVNKMTDSGMVRILSNNPDTKGSAYDIKLDSQRIAPTENVKGQQSYLGGQFDGKDGDKILRGEVHDPTSYRMGGIAGHAGLFSTADDLARFCQMLLNGGILDGKRILSSNTISRMITPIVVSETGETRGLGWDINTAFSSNRGELFPLGSFGHTGFTGTSLWIDPVTQTFVVIMSNRVHPDGKGDATPIRARIATIAASAVEDTPPEIIRSAEAAYSSQVAAQIEKFKAQSSKFKAQDSSSQITTNNEQRTTNKTVLNGIDVLEKNNFKELNNLKIGLVTNQTGRDLDGVATIDVLKNAPNVKLTALFSPEHGIRGELDQSKINDSVDEKTGVPVYSLYGETRRPKPEQLKDLDAIVYDIQDVGVRFYTYEATLLNVLEEAAKAGKPVYVLDRPNPIGGETIEGPNADADKLNFVVSHTVPVRHGLTIGELAQMMNAEKKLGADLRIIKMDGWTRAAWFDQTNQTWINPSPNMRSLTEATLYPGIGLLETTNLSVGRGTDTPFEIVGAPWIDGRKLAEVLNGKNLAGVRFVPIRFKPNASVFKDENCGGINILMTDRAKFKPVAAGLEIAAALRRLYPNDWKVDGYIRLLANSDLFEKIKGGAPTEEVEKSETKSVSDFAARRASYLLYK